MYVKLYEGHADRDLHLLLDCSPSMGLGRPAKFQLARQVAAALGYVSLCRLDRLMVAAYADGLVAGLPPLRHESRVLRLLRFLEGLSCRAGVPALAGSGDTCRLKAELQRGTNLLRAVETFVRRPQRQGPVIVISDLYDAEGFQRGCDLLRFYGYDPRLVQIVDPADGDSSLLGDVELVDVRIATRHAGNDYRADAAAVSATGGRVPRVGPRLLPAKGNFSSFVAVRHAGGGSLSPCAGMSARRRTENAGGGCAMSFAHPQALLLLLLLIPVGLLYWLRLRVPRVVVGTGLFWQKALAEEPLRARWQRWRTPVSLVLHVLTVIMLALAAAGPQIPPPQRIVLILDNSATMRATDVLPSRFDAAKQAARRMIDNLGWCDEMAIVTTSPQPMEVQTFTGDQSLLGKTITSVQVEAKPPMIESAADVAEVIGISQKPPPKIVLITDASGERKPGACREPACREVGVRVIRVGESADNRAMTCFSATEQDRFNAMPSVCRSGEHQRSFDPRQYRDFCRRRTSGIRAICH